MACDCFRVPTGVDATKLGPWLAKSKRWPRHLQVERGKEQQLAEYDRSPLKGDCGPRGVVETIDVHHATVYQSCRLGQEPLEGCEERRVVQGPF